MDFTSQDLPPEIKKQLLDQARTQLGPRQFQMAVDQLGEDGLIDQVLRSLRDSQPANSKNTSRFSLPSFLWDHFWSWGWMVVAAVSPPVFAILLAVILLVGLYQWLYGVFKPMSHDPSAEALTGLIMIVIVIVLGGAFVVFAIPWLWQGSLNWWGWLSAHF